MIADVRRSQEVLRSSAIIWKHTSAIVCDPAIVIAEDRTIFCDRLRSCDHMENKVPSAIETYPIIFLGFDKTLTPGQLTPCWPPIRSMGKWKFKKPRTINLVLLFWLLCYLFLFRDDEAAAAAAAATTLKEHQRLSEREARLVVTVWRLKYQ